MTVPGRNARDIHTFLFNPPQAIKPRKIIQNRANAALKCDDMTTVCNSVLTLCFVLCPPPPFFSLLLVDGFISPAVGVTTPGLQSRGGRVVCSACCGVVHVALIPACVVTLILDVCRSLCFHI